MSGGKYDPQAQPRAQLDAINARERAERAQRRAAVFEAARLRDAAAKRYGMPNRHVPGTIAFMLLYGVTRPPTRDEPVEEEQTRCRPKSVHVAHVRLLWPFRARGAGRHLSRGARINGTVARRVGRDRAGRAKRLIFRRRSRD